MYRSTQLIYAEVILYESLGSENVCSLRSVGTHIVPLAAMSYSEGVTTLCVRM